MTRILLTHSPRSLANYYGERALRELRGLGEVRLNPGEDPTTPQALIDLAQDCQIIVSDRQAAAPAAVFDALPDLVAFCRVAMDVRNIDVEAASRRGVLVTRATPGFAASVAEWVVGAMIDASRGISRAVHAYRRGAAPEIAMGRELRGATLGIVGHGAIGAHLSPLALAFGMRVLVSDPAPAAALPAGVRSTDMDALLRESDYVVCLAPALPQTANLIDAAALARMKRDAVFINASRGELVDEAALLDALDRGLIAGCALDVGRAPDQMPSPALAAHPRVIATPHIGGLTPEATQHQAMDTVAQVRAMLEGRMPPHALNPGHATRLVRLTAHTSEVPR